MSATPAKFGRISRHSPLESLPELLRVEEAAAFCDVSPSVIYGMVAKGVLESRRFGRLVRIPRTSLARFIEHPAGAGGAR